MHTLIIDITEQREVNISSLFAGNTGENNETLLSFEIPEKYSLYYKYLDIITENGKKTQTVVSTKDERRFSYKIPSDFTDGRCVYLQLVMKKGENIFKSNMFSLIFNPSISAGQHILGDNKDTLQFIMENKADKEEIKDVEREINRKLDSSIFYSYTGVQEFASNSKVDKQEGKDLSTNDFTDEYKNTLDNLPDNLEDIFFEINSERLRINNHDSDISEIRELIGDINSALDELHNYAQAIISGGVK